MSDLTLMLEAAAAARTTRSEQRRWSRNAKKPSAKE
jgi:hypothetical protein